MRWIHRLVLWELRQPTGNRTTTIWNYENQPTLYRLPAGARVTYTYNADNDRVSKET
jgi:YD repeat-containing protein